MTTAAPPTALLLSTAAIEQSLRTALEHRIPGTGAIGPWVRLDRLHGYDETAAAEILADAFDEHGLTFELGDVARHCNYLADLIGLVDRVVATGLHSRWTSSPDA